MAAERSTPFMPAVVLSQSLVSTAFVPFSSYAVEVPMKEKLPTHATCPACGIKTRLTGYVYAHWDIELIRTCDCGCAHGLLRGHSYVLPSQRKKSISR